MLTRIERIRHEITGERLDLIEFARLLRQTATDAEGLMWACLRDRRVNQCKFRRQHPVKPYVLDFYCAGLRLAIELDGGQHNSVEGRKHDAGRAAFLMRRGIETLRFTNDEIFRFTDSVLGVIWDKTRQMRSSHSSPQPSPPGGEGV